ALVASMNRGARVVSSSGGFTSQVHHQRMVRCPMLLFDTPQEAQQFQHWIVGQIPSIRQEAERHSNHSQLLELKPVVLQQAVHLRFVYTTGDASGQNMTTTCTWHALLWIKKQFEQETGISPRRFVIEGNGSGDKKVTQYNQQHGRGLHVEAHCTLAEPHIRKILRTTPEAFLECFHASRELCRQDGMVGYNINVANAVAALFVATGQDLGSIHESAVGVLDVQPSAEGGLAFTLTLPNLVVGTVGGGTHLPKQREALALMDCLGQGKISRFGQLIAGFALALEISTFAAIVGGHFAAAHEKLGRNKPKAWITPAQLNTSFIRQGLHASLPAAQLTEATRADVSHMEDGILMGLAHTVSRKVLGFHRFQLHWQDSSTPLPKDLLIKSKPLGHEAVEGLHVMASAVDPELAHLLLAHQDSLEYARTHLKEIQLYQHIHQLGLGITPTYYGHLCLPQQEVYMLFQEYLPPGQVRLMDSQNEPEQWDPASIRKALDAIHRAHRSIQPSQLPAVPPFDVQAAHPLYARFVQIIQEEYQDTALAGASQMLSSWLQDLQAGAASTGVDRCVIHNDFNPRNVALRSNGQICIYDWELATLNLPQRDVVEFLSFVLPPDFSPAQLQQHLRYHTQQWADRYTQQQVQAALRYALKEYVITRLLFYLTGRIVVDFGFAERVFRTALRMHQLLQYPLIQPAPASHA
ncbi:MAG: phosphotransferase, partial [Bacteroidota bacterium]